MSSQRLPFVKNFAFMFLHSWSSISYARPVAVTGAWTKLHLLSQPSRYEVFLVRWVQEVDLQVLLHSPLLNNTNLSLLIVSACDVLAQTQGLCGHPTKTCLPVMLNEPASASSSVVRLYALELTGLKKWYNFLFLVQSDPRQIFFFHSSQTSFILSIEI